MDYTINGAKIGDRWVWLTGNGVEPSVVESGKGDHTERGTSNCHALNNGWTVYKLIKDSGRNRTTPIFESLFVLGSGTGGLRFNHARTTENNAYSESVIDFSYQSLAVFNPGRVLFASGVLRATTKINPTR